MFIRWMFCFSEKNFSIEVRDESEDKRISEAVNSDQTMLVVPGIEKEVYLNLKYCQAIVREVVHEEEKCPEATSQDEATAPATTIPESGC